MVQETQVVQETGEYCRHLRTTNNHHTSTCIHVAHFSEVAVPKASSVCSTDGTDNANCSLTLETAWQSQGLLW